MSRIPTHQAFVFLCWVLCAGAWNIGCASSRSISAHALNTRVAAPERLENKALQYSANIERWIKGERVRLQVLMLAALPDQMRIDLMTQVGSSGVLTVNGDTLALYDKQNRVLKKGEVCASTLKSAIGIALQPEELLRIVMADPIALPGTEKQIPRSNDIRVERRAASGEVQRLWYRSHSQSCGFDDAAQLDMAELYDAVGRRVWRVQYTDYEPVRTESTCVNLPRQIRFVGRDRYEVRIDVKSIRLREAIDPEVFSQSAEPGVRSEAIVCQ